MELDRYVARASPLHAADARLKFILTVAFIVAISLLPVGAFLAIVIAWLTLVALSWWARLGPLRTARSAFFALPFMLAALPLVFAPTADPLATWTIGPLTVTVSAEGIARFLTIAAKSWVSVQAALLLAFTTPFHELIDGLRELRLPRIMIAIIGFMYRYLGVIGDEAGRMNRARASRSAVVAGRGGGSLRWRGSVTGHMVGSLFLRSYERSERVFAAMQARGFDGTFRSLAGPPIPRRQFVAFGFGLAALVAFEAAAHLWRLGA